MLPNLPAADHVPPRALRPGNATPKDDPVGDGFLAMIGGDRRAPETSDPLFAQVRSEGHEASYSFVPSKAPAAPSPDMDAPNTERAVTARAPTQMPSTVAPAAPSGNGAAVAGPAPVTIASQGAVTALDEAQPGRAAGGRTGPLPDATGTERWPSPGPGGIVTPRLTTAQPGLTTGPQQPRIPTTPDPAPLPGHAAPVSGLAPRPLLTMEAAPDPAGQVVRAVTSAAPGERVIELRLDPPSLGRVRIELDFSGETVRAVVAAVEPEALNALRRGQAGLVRDLADLGLPDAEIEYAERGADEARDDVRRGEALGDFAAQDAPRDFARPSAPARPVLHDGALDIIL